MPMIPHAHIMASLRSEKDPKNIEIYRRISFFFWTIGPCSYPCSLADDDVRADLAVRSDTDGIVNQNVSDNVLNGLVWNTSKMPSELIYAICNIYKFEKLTVTHSFGFEQCYIMMRRNKYNQLCTTCREQF